MIVIERKELKIGIGSTIIKLMSMSSRNRNFVNEAEQMIMGRE